MKKVIFFERLRELAKLTELAMRSRIMRSGKLLTVSTSDMIGSKGFPKKIVVRDKGGASIHITKDDPRLAHVDLLRSQTEKHGTTASASSLKSLVPVLKNFKKNKIDVQYLPLAMSSSQNKGAVTDTTTLNGHYHSIATKLGFKPEEAKRGQYILRA